MPKKSAADEAVFVMPEHRDPPEAVGMPQWVWVVRIHSRESNLPPYYLPMAYKWKKHALTKIQDTMMKDAFSSSFAMLCKNLSWLIACRIFHCQRW
jgi:hypothetical protein